MLNAGIIGIGNAGNQVAALAKEKLVMDAIAINSSEKDLQTLPDSVIKILIGDSKGAGKDRLEAKKFLKDKIIGLLKSEQIGMFMNNKEIVFIVSSTGGGTGSGTAPILSEILRQTFPDVNVILVGILPTLTEALSTQANTLEYLEELYSLSTNPTYMLYDNDRCSKLPSHMMMSKINETIVNDIDILRGTYQIPTKFASIDEKDMSRITGTSGRMVIAAVRDIKEKTLDEKTIDELLISEFKSNTHAEMQRDKRIHRIGIISNLSERINESFDSSLPQLQDFIGAPVEEFEHISINTDTHLPNNVFVIASGLSKINDRIRKIKDRIDEIDSKQTVEEEEDELEGFDVSKLNSRREQKKVISDEVDLKNIFSKYGL